MTPEKTQWSSLLFFASRQSDFLVNISRRKSCRTKALQVSLHRCQENQRLQADLENLGEAPSLDGRSGTKCCQPLSLLPLFRSCLELRIFKCFIRLHSTYKTLYVFKPICKKAKRLKYTLMTLSSSGTVLFKLSRHQCRSTIAFLTWTPDYSLTFGIACVPVVCKHFYIQLFRKIFIMYHTGWPRENTG